MASPLYAGDVLITPECHEDAFLVSLWARKGEFVMFSEDHDGSGSASPASTIVVAACQSRRALAYKEDKPIDLEKLTQAEKLLLQIVKTQDQSLMRDAARQIKSLGLRGKELSLPRAHCACALFFPPADDARMNPAASQ